MRCGLDMVRSIDELGAAQRALGASDLRVRVGINTGPVVVGVVGTDTAHEYTAMGDAVNIAARMQATARAGSVLVTAATYRFVSTLVEAVDVGHLELKGKTDTVRAYEITGLKADAMRTRGLLGVRAPMIGRDAQLGRLRDLYGVVRARQGRVASVLGEPGMGKSRLLAELRESVERSDGSVRWIEGRCMSYGESMPYHLVLDLVRSMIGVGASADESQVATALETSLRDLLEKAGPKRTPISAIYFRCASTPKCRRRYRPSSRRRSNVMSHRWWASSALSAAVGRWCWFAMTCTGPTPLRSTPCSRCCRPWPGCRCSSSSALGSNAASAGWRLIAGARDIFGDALTEIRLEPLSTQDSRTLVSNSSADRFIAGRHA